MQTAPLKKFAQAARRQLQESVAAGLDKVLFADSIARRESPKVVAELENRIRQTSKEAVIERTAYIWFNRFCALRFMDVNHYTKLGTVSPLEGFTQPELLTEAKQGHMDSDLEAFVKSERVFDLLSGKSPSPDPQAEVYRKLLVAVCNYYHRIMPFLFEKIADYTELLMPDDLLSENSILANVREALTPETCKDVEVIGWLYQFYISEKKDEVFEGLKKNKKITPENIPAATQLFTPNWIVRYLVENSLGRLWMLNRPDSRLVGMMEYYIKPEEVEKDFLKISGPEEIKVCDPACGSGHMLVYAFELLYAIYEEDGYEANEIPELILTKNLFGIEIDERAGELAAFALTMKAREKYKRFFSKPVKPQVCVLEKVSFEKNAIMDYMDEMGQDLFTASLEETLHQFEEADNFGSLIRPDCENVKDVLKILKKKDMEGKLLIHMTHEKVLKVLRQADYLSSKYHAVIANPPYMGGKGMNGRLGEWLKDNYADVKSDLFSAFIVRNTELTLPKGQLGFMSPFVWMFISSYEKLRSFLLDQKTLTSLVQLEYSGFDGATVPICTFTVEKSLRPDFKGGYVRLSDFRGAENQGPKALEAIKNPKCGWFFRASATDFNKIPSSPIAYWVSDRIRKLFIGKKLGDFFNTEGQNKTTDNEKYLRYSWEVEKDRVGKGKKWVRCAKGGPFRKWEGNIEHLIDWSPETRSFYRKDNSARIVDEKFWYMEGITWTDITSSSTAFRFLEGGCTYETAGPTLFVNGVSKYVALAYLNTPVVARFIKIMNPTFHVKVKDIRALPIREPTLTASKVEYFTTQLIQLTKEDWNAYETSWCFNSQALRALQGGVENGREEEFHSPFFLRCARISETYVNYRDNWLQRVLKVKQLEEEINRIFIEAYALQDELTPEVPLKEITLTCNPHYRYGANKTEEELEKLLLADTMKEFISYAVGCMLGRYSLDKPGLILANQGETIEDYLKQIPDPTFPADDDNVIPMLDGEWFTDDITERFFKFLRVTFGEEHYDENLRYLEEGIGKDVRKYFLKDFYTDHIKRYKKRPIYWLFSSPKGSFNALIYMHRYQPDTVSVVLNDYLREFRIKLNAHIEHLEQVSISGSATAAQKVKAVKEMEKLKTIVDELNDYERDTLYPLATQKIEIDLDDGVKANYPKFGKALKKVPGLTGK